MKKNLLTLGLSLSLLGLVAQTPRLSLYEEFTGETCPPCASTNPGLNALLAQPANTANCVAIKWQVPIPSAPTKTWSLYQTNKAEIDWRYSQYGYGINSAPSGKMDGQNVTLFGAGSNHPATLNSTVIATAASYTSPFSITMARAWNQGCTAVNLTITVQASANFTSAGNLIFRTVMVERLIQFSVQPGTNGEKDFEDVAIKSFPSIQGGTPLASSWTNGQSFTFTLSCPVPAYTRKKTEVAFVGFIQDDGNKKVIQAVRAGKAAVPADALAAMGASVNITCTNSITPSISLKNDGPNAITSMTIYPYTDAVAAAPFTWSGNLAPGATTVLALSTITTPTAAGAHTFSFTVDLNVPVYNLTSSINKATYYVAAAYPATPVAEGFVSTSFPPAGWASINANNGASWSRTNVAGGYNLTSESAKYDFYNNTTIGDVDELYFPPIDLSGSGDPVLSFDIAYAQRTSVSNDKLEIMVSDNCGGNWTTVYTAAGANLTTLPPVSSPYVPDPSDASHWRTETITLTGYNKSSLIFKFVATNGNGNNLYIDNVNLAQTGPVGIKNIEQNAAQFVLFPNPANAQVQLSLSDNAGAAQIIVMNALGQVVISKMLSAKENTLTLDVKQLPAGAYLVNVKTAQGESTKKLLIQN